MILSTPPYNPSSNQNDINSINIKINSSASSPTTLKRKDTFQIKQKLSEVLGPNGKEYWKCLKNYLIGKLSKNEFDKSIKNLIGDQLQLHNSFIYSIIYNSQRDMIPRDGSSLPLSSENADSKERNSLKRKHKYNKANGNVKRMKLKDEFLSLEKIDRDKIRGLIKKYPSPKDEIPTFSSHFLPKPSKKIPPSFKDMQDVPGINDSLLKERVEFVASLEGINTVTDEALVLMNYAIRSRLKGIIENCVNKQIKNENELETPITPLIPIRHSVRQASYEESDNLINHQPLPKITVTDSSNINNINANATATINNVDNSNDKKENENSDINKENINNNTKEQIKDISSILPNNLIENNQKDSSNSISNVKIEEKIEEEKKKDTDNQEKKDNVSTETNNKDTNTSTEIKTGNSSDSKNPIPLLRDKILKVKASLQKKLQEEGQHTTAGVMHTMKPGALLCERGCFIEVSKKFSNGIKPNSTISIETLDTIPLTNLSKSSRIHKNRAEEIFKTYSKDSLETIKESEDETNSTTTAATVNSMNATVTPSPLDIANPLLSSLPSSSTSSLLKDIKHEEKDSFNAISKDDDLFNDILSSSDILNQNSLLGNTFGNTLLPSTTSVTPSLASAIVTPSSTSPAEPIQKEESTETPLPNIDNKINPIKPLSLLSNDEVFSEFDIDANLTQNNLISLQDIYFAHEINPQHIFGNSAYSSEVLENLICVLSENDHSLVE